MSDDGKKRPFEASFVNLAMSLFFAVILLALTVELAKKIWWLLVLLALVAAAVAVARWIYARKKRWEA